MALEDGLVDVIGPVRLKTGRQPTMIAFERSFGPRLASRIARRFDRGSTGDGVAAPASPTMIVF
jgi:hypothetical protein